MMNITDEQKLDKIPWAGVDKLANNQNLLPSNQGDQPTLFNTMLAALAEPKKGIAAYKGGKYAEAMRRNVQSQIATSQKFVVSNSMVEHAFLASMSKPIYLLGMLARGIPPFNNMWIEWDEEFRRSIVIRELDKLGIDARSDDKNDASDRVGYHIQMMNNKFVYTNYFRGKGEKMASAPIAFHISNDSVIANDNPDQDHQAFLADQALTGNSLIGNWYRDKYMSPDVLKYVDEDIPMSRQDVEMSLLLRSFVQIQGASIHWLVTQDQFARGWTHQEMAELKAMSLASQSGDGRFLIALLGLLNYDLIVHETKTPPKHINHKRFGRVVPKNEYKVVEIKLPKPRGKRIYEKMFTGQGSPKKEHWRRGHWRKLKDRFGRIKKWVWIGEMKVGNPALGTIVHDYHLQGSTISKKDDDPNKRPPTPW